MKLTHYQIKKIVEGAGLVLLAALIIIGVHLYVARQRIIPHTVASQISFTVFWPKSTNAFPSQSSIKYDSQKGVFSYIVTINNVSTTVTEQATPSEFVDIPNYYSALINHLNNYDTFGSSHGNVYLTKPSGTDGETAVINQSGTLLFAHAQADIDENNWRLFFNNLRVIEN